MGIAAALPSGVLQYPWPVDSGIGSAVPAVGLINVVKSAFGFNEVYVGWTQTDVGSPGEADSITVVLRTGPSSPPTLKSPDVNLRPDQPRRFRVNGSDNIQIEVVAVNVVDPMKKVAFYVWGADPIRFQKI